MYLLRQERYFSGLLRWYSFTRALKHALHHDDNPSLWLVWA
jgi:hypothetical protein